MEPTKEETTITTMVNSDIIDGDGNSTDTGGTSSTTSYTRTTDFRILEKHETITNQNREHDLTSAGWSFGIMFQYSYDPTMVELEFYGVQKYASGATAAVVLEAVPCDETNFNVDLFENLTYGASMLDLMV